jgi:hypothetical protein
MFNLQTKRKFQLIIKNSFLCIILITFILLIACTNKKPSKITSIKFEKEIIIKDRLTKKTHKLIPINEFREIIKRQKKIDIKTIKFLKLTKNLDLLFLIVIH